jgi:MFS family permease
MARRWFILAALTLARTTMGFQFQSIPAVSHHLTDELGMSYAALGTLIGLYLFPGIAFALPGGWLGQRFGDKRVVLLGLGLMALGGVLLGLSEERGVMIAGRVLSGSGAVLLNVLVTKMVADWFEGHEIVTAMGILIASWPLGIALAMVSLPTLADVFAWPNAMLAGAVTAGACFALVAIFYTRPTRALVTSAERLRITLGRRELILAILAGFVWTFYNVSFISVLAFAPDYLGSQGTSAVAAAATVSLVSWLIIPSLPTGAWLAQRLDHPDLTMVGCCLVVVALIWAIPLWGSSVLLFVAMGLLFGPPGPLIMVLPVEGVRAENRAVGMGIYFTCYYVGMTIALPFAGLARDMTGDPAAPLWLAGAALLIALASLVVFRVIQRSGDSQWIR